MLAMVTCILAFTGGCGLTVAYYRLYILWREISVDITRVVFEA